MNGGAGSDSRENIGYPIRVFPITQFDSRGLDTIGTGRKMEDMGRTECCHLTSEEFFIQEIGLLPKLTMMLRFGWVSVEIEKGFSFGEKPLDCV